MNSETGQKNWWRTLKHFIKPEQTNAIPPLSKDGTIYSDDIDKANVLNDFFVDQTFLDDSTASLPQTVNVPDYNLDSLNISREEVESTLKSLPLGKAAGPDLINNRILKELAQPLSLPLCDLFNVSVSHGKVPKLWKQDNVSPIHKKMTHLTYQITDLSLFLVLLVKFWRKLYTNIYITSFKNIILLRLYNQGLFPEIPL